MNAYRFDDWETPAKPDASRLLEVSHAAHSQSEDAGSSALPALAPVNAADKRIVGGKTDINQLAPFKYPWAWEFFLKANRNHWTPLEISMAQDVHDYHHKLSGAERHVFENVLAYLTTSDILAMRNIGLAVMEKMSAPELQIYQARQVYEEALLREAHEIIGSWDNTSLSSGQAEIIEELRNIEENPYPYEVIE